MGKSGITVLGSTGSIGVQTLQVMEYLGLPVAALTAGTNVTRLEEQARRFRPKLVCMADETAARDLAVRLGDTGIPVLSGPEGLEEAAAIESDCVVTAVVGTAGLRPTMAAIREGRRIGIANKETLVCAGRLVMAAAEKYGAELLPVDSEHSAIFQCLREGRGYRPYKKIILTASGGPFRGWTREKMVAVTPSMALKHPNWSMGAKITIDSATLMNKGLEFIEAMHLFGASPEKIQVLVHPQSLIHSMVVLADNAVLGQLGTADMRLPIQLALTWPERLPSLASEPDFAALGSVSFEAPDLAAFPALALAMETAPRQDAACAVMSAANEEAVYLFLEGKIGFCDIFDRTAAAVERITSPAESVEDILAADAEARSFVRNQL